MNTAQRSDRYRSSTEAMLMMPRVAQKAPPPPPGFIPIEDYERDQMRSSVVELVLDDAPPPPPRFVPYKPEGVADLPPGFVIQPMEPSQALPEGFVIQPVEQQDQPEAGFQSYFGGTVTPEMVRAQSDALWDGLDDKAQAARSIAQGVTFNHWDEIESSVREAAGQDEATITAAERRFNTWKENNPGRNITGEILGSLLIPGFGVGKAAIAAGRHAGTTGRVATMGAAGAGFGAVDHHGRGEGEFMSEDRTEGMGRSAAVGGVLGGLGTPVFDLMANLTKAGGIFLNQAVPAPYKMADKAVLKALEKDAKAAGRTLEEQFNHVFPNASGDTAREAVYEAQRVPLREFTDNVRRPTPRIETAPVLAEGQALRNLTRQVLEASSSARNTISGLANLIKTGSGQRLQAAVDDIRDPLLNTGTFNEMIEEMSAARAQQGNAAFQRLFDRAPIQAAPLGEFSSAPTFDKAWKQANRLLADQGTTPTPFSVIADGGLVTPQFVVALKKSLDDVRDTAFRSGMSHRGHSVRELHDSFLRVADEMLPPIHVGAQRWPGYSDVRREYGLATSEIKAAQQGRALVLNDGLRHDLEMAQFDKMAKEDKRLFQMGFQQAVLDKVRNSRDGGRWLEMAFEKDGFRETFDRVMNWRDLPDDLEGQLVRNELPASRIDPSTIHRNIATDDAGMRFLKEAELAEAIAPLRTEVKSAERSATSRPENAFGRVATAATKSRGGLIADIIHLGEAASSPVTRRRAVIIADMLAETSPDLQRATRERLRRRYSNQQDAKLAVQALTSALLAEGAKRSSEVIDARE